MAGSSLIAPLIRRSQILRLEAENAGIEAHARMRSLAEVGSVEGLASFAAWVIASMTRYQSKCFFSN